MVKPTNILVNEHRIIEQVLNCLERMIARCASAGKLEEAPARKAIGFFRVRRVLRIWRRKRSTCFLGWQERSALRDATHPT